MLSEAGLDAGVDGNGGDVGPLVQSLLLPLPLTLVLLNFLFFLLSCLFFLLSAFRKSMLKF